MTTDAAVRVKGLQKSYKDLHVLRSVDFDVAPGSIFALLGSNGAGNDHATAERAGVDQPYRAVRGR